MDKLLCGNLARRILLAGKNRQRDLKILSEKRFHFLKRDTDLNKTVTLKREFHFSSVVSTQYFTKDHEWIKMDGDVGTIGITVFAAEQLGDIVYCELPDMEAEYQQGDTMAVIESVKAASDLYAPVSGQVVEINSAVVDDPSIISTFPTDEGWLVKMKLSKPSEIESLLDEAKYNELIKEE